MQERDERLHNLRSDPTEQENVLDQYPEVAAEFRRYLQDLVARRGRGCRLWLIAKEPAVVRLRASSPIRHYQIPALSPDNALTVSEDQQELALQIEGPDVVLVILGLEPGATLSVAAECGGRPLPTSQIHLGGAGEHPPNVPFTLGDDVPFAALRAEQSPPLRRDPSETALWLWQPTAERTEEAVPMDVDTATRRQLRALGYVD